MKGGEGEKRRIGIEPKIELPVTLRLKVGAKDKKPLETEDRTGMTMWKREGSAVSNAKERARQRRTKSRPLPSVMRKARVFFAR